MLQHQAERADGQQLDQSLVLYSHKDPESPRQEHISEATSPLKPPTIIDMRRRYSVPLGIRLAVLGLFALGASLIPGSGIVNADTTRNPVLPIVESIPGEIPMVNDHLQAGVEMHTDMAEILAFEGRAMIPYIIRDGVQSSTFYGGGLMGVAGDGKVEKQLQVGFTQNGYPRYDVSGTMNYADGFTTIRFLSFPNFGNPGQFVYFAGEQDGLGNWTLHLENQAIGAKVTPQIFTTDGLDQNTIRVFYQSNLGGDYANYQQKNGAFALFKGISVKTTTAPATDVTFTGIRIYTFDKKIDPVITSNGNIKLVDVTGASSTTP